MGKLDGKIALVTGASRGIGKSIAEVFASEGAKVVCTARTVNEGDHVLEGSLNATVKGITDQGGDATAVACDVSEFANIEKCFEDVHKAYGPIDVLVNNAALTYFIPVAEFPLRKWMRSFAVNFHAPFYLSQLALKDMIPKKAGSIVNISSGAAIGPGRGPYKAPVGRGATLYGAEKAALERFTQGLASEVFKDGISVTCVSPTAIVPTPGVLHHKLIKDANDPRAEAPEIMARAALLLATEPIDKITGRVTYSQEILQEFGQLSDKEKSKQGIGRGSGYSQI